MLAELFTATFGKVLPGRYTGGEGRGNKEHAKSSGRQKAIKIEGHVEAAKATRKQIKINRIKYAGVP